MTTSSGFLSSHKPGRMGARNFLICDELPRRLRGFAVALAAFYVAESLLARFA
jgi:hypothetical protein